MLIAAIVGAAFGAIAIGFIVDLTLIVRRQAVLLRLIREEQTAYKVEILHHIQHLAVGNHTTQASGGRSREARLAQLRSRLGD